MITSNEPSCICTACLTEFAEWKENPHLVDGFEDFECDGEIVEDNLPQLRLSLDYVEREAARIFTLTQSLGSASMASTDLDHELRRKLREENFKTHNALDDFRRQVQKIEEFRNVRRRDFRIRNHPVVEVQRQVNEAKRVALAVQSQLDEFRRRPSQISSARSTTRTRERGTQAQVDVVPLSQIPFFKTTMRDPYTELSKELLSMPLEARLFDMGFECGACRSKKVHVIEPELGVLVIESHDAGRLNCRNSGRRLGLSEIMWVQHKYQKRSTVT